MKIEHIPCAPFVNESERKAFETIKSKLSGSPEKVKWIFLTNCFLSVNSDNCSDEIDMIAIGPTGVHIIEVKHWDADFISKYPDEVNSQAELINNKAKKIKSKLKNCREIGFIEGKILITKGNYKANPSKQRPRFRGISIFGLNEFSELLDLKSSPRFFPSIIDDICRKIEPKTKLPLSGDIRSLGDYVNLNRISPAHDRFHRIFKGIHKKRRNSIILHVYDLSASDEKDALKLAQREFDAIQHLQKSKWVPRLLDSFQQLPTYPGEMYFFSIIDPVSPTIHERSQDKNWSLDDRISFAICSAKALLELHEPGDENEPIIHRNLTKHNIHVKTNNEPLFSGFMFSKLYQESTLSNIALSSVSHTEDMPPEILTGGFGVADTRSDIYSLCSSLKILFNELYDAPKAQAVLQIFEGGMNKNTDKRTDLKKIVEELQQLYEDNPKKSKIILPSARYWDEETQITFNDNEYRIIAKLGSGGVGMTFKVAQISKNSGDSIGTFVGKAIFDENDGKRALEAYEIARSYTANHPNLASIFEYAKEWEENQFVALMRWVEGFPLSELKGILPIYAEDLGISCEDLVLKWLGDICDGLSALHKVGLVHGDVSPKNIIVNQSEVTLTDYDTVTHAEKNPRGRGTPLYRSPDIDTLNKIKPSDDIFSLAATFFHMMFDHDPFVDNMHHGLNWKENEHDEFPHMTVFFDKAANQDPNNRFVSAMEAKSFISQISGKTIPMDKPLTANKIEWLSSLLKTYPGSLHGCEETRGIDSDFAVNTYVETDLDQEILKEIKKGRIALIILCGNAGDGKTAFLQYLAKGLGISDTHSSNRLWDITLDSGLHVRANLDGSAAFQGRSATELLDEIFEPFHQGDCPESIVHLIAINNGPLLAWIEDYENRHNNNSTPLTEMLWNSLETNLLNLPNHIRFIDLNNRSLVGGVGKSFQITTGFLDKLIMNLLNKPELWEPCLDCIAQRRCTAWHSVQLLTDKEKSTMILQRLYEAFQAVHQRGEIHITTRELKASLSYIFFGIHSCEDLHDPAIETIPYYERVFNPLSPNRQGDLLRELVCLDPALEAHALIDRQLAGNRNDAKEEGLLRVDSQTKFLESARRHAYFEWSDEKKIQIGLSKDSVQLARGRHLTRFRNLPFFSPEDKKLLCKDLCRGIANLENLPPIAFKDENVIPLKVTPRTPTESAIWVIKPIERFSVEADITDTGGLFEKLHTHIVLRYNYVAGHCEELLLNTELFHILLELKDGYQITDVFSDDIFANLSIFTQRLTQEDDRVLYAWNPVKDDVVYKVEAQYDEKKEQQNIVITQQ